MTLSVILYHMDLRFTVYVAEGEWKLIVRTSDFENAGTSARVFVTFYGVKSHSDKLLLTNEDSNPFQRGKESTFTVFICHFHVFNFLLKILAKFIAYFTVHSSFIACRILIVLVGVDFRALVYLCDCFLNFVLYYM